MALAFLVAGAIAAPLAAADEPLEYVALGDSSAAGPGIPEPIHTNCGRSDHNWPHLLAGTLNATLTDVSCSSATIAHFTSGQFLDAPPQFDALTEDTDLVTLAIGANDIGLGWAFSCRNTTDGRTCEQRLAAAGLRYPAEIARTAPKVTTALEEIRRKSPNAEIVVVGYLTYWRPGGCPATDGMASVDADFVQATFNSLMAMLADRAGAQGATYVDIRTPSADHSLCEPANQRWLEGANAVGALPYHPNAAGMANAAAIIADTVKAR